MPLAIAAAFWSSAHIRVDIMFGSLSKPLQRHLLRASTLVAAVVTGFLCWAAWGEMRSQLDFTTTSATLGIAYTWYWIPLILGLAFSVMGSLILTIFQAEDDDG